MHWRKLLILIFQLNRPHLLFHSALLILCRIVLWVIGSMLRRLVPFCCVQRATLASVKLIFTVLVNWVFIFKFDYLRICNWCCSTLCLPFKILAFHIVHIFFQIPCRLRIFIVSALWIHKSIRVSIINNTLCRISSILCVVLTDVCMPWMPLFIFVQSCIGFPWHLSFWNLDIWEEWCFMPLFAIFESRIYWLVLLIRVNLIKHTAQVVHVSSKPDFPWLGILCLIQLIIFCIFINEWHFFILFNFSISLSTCNLLLWNPELLVHVSTKRHICIDLVSLFHIQIHEFLLHFFNFRLWVFHFLLAKSK